MSTINIDSPASDVIGIHLNHFVSLKKDPSFLINNQDPKVVINEQNDGVKFTSGKLSVRASYKSEFRLSFDADGKELTASQLGAQGEIEDNERQSHYMREQLDIKPDEHIYGFGEHFTPFVKNGQTVDIWNQDAGTGSEQGYKNIPFYMSNKGYGIFVNNTGKVSYEVASENVNRVQFSVSGESLEYYVIFGPSPKEILNKYTELTGKIGLPPAWTFGLWLSTSFTTDYKEETVLKFIDGMKARKIPLDVFHFDCFWQKDFEWSNLEWNSELFPNPKKLIQEIHDRGVKVCVWINPYVSQKTQMFEEGAQNGYFVRRKNGEIWQWDMWQPGSAFVDFTNPKAVEWFQSKLKHLLREGVDCFKTDFGERIPVKDAKYFDSSTPAKEHNYYTYQYNKAVYEAIQDVKGSREAVVFARSATVGSQKFPVHWGGDNLSNYASMADSLRGGLSLLCSGFGFWSHDIGGFEENATADIYKRWTQFGLLSSHSRYHGSIQYRVPWVFDEEAVENTRKYVNLKLSLMPYIYEAAVTAHEYGTPVMRPIFFEFPEDRNTDYLDNEYMFGSDILVAPIFNDQGKVNYYLPGGKWTNLLSNHIYDVNGDGKWLSEKYAELDLPILVRENSILILNKQAEHAEYDYSKDVEIHIYQVGMGRHEKRVVDQEGNDLGNVLVVRTNKKIVVTAPMLRGKVNVFVHQGNVILENRLINGESEVTI